MRVIEVEDFYCKGRRMKVTFDKCHIDYVNANASSSSYTKKDGKTSRLKIKARRSCCWRCQQGRENRNNDAFEGWQILREGTIFDSLWS